MSSSGEEQLFRTIKTQTYSAENEERNIEERRLFGIENPREFRKKYRLPVEAFKYLLSAVGQQLDHKTK